MFKVNLHPLCTTNDIPLTRVICVAKYQGKWIFCKHKKRSTWEIPGGHIEKGETWQQAAKRELYEETGAIQANITPICLYSISTYGILCYAEVIELSKLPTSEIEKIEFFDNLPSQLTYPEAHTLFFETVKNFKGECNEKN